MKSPARPAKGTPAMQKLVLLFLDFRRAERLAPRTPQGEEGLREELRQAKRASTFRPPSPMADLQDEDDKLPVPELADQPVVSHVVAPIPRELTGQGRPLFSWIGCGGQGAQKIHYPRMGGFAQALAKGFCRHLFCVQLGQHR